MLGSEVAKRHAGEAAGSLIGPNQVVGAGSGSTVNYFLSAVARRSPDNVAFVPTSLETEIQLRQLCLPIVSLPVDGVSISVDGADQVDRRSFFAIKGAGAAFTREKIVARSAREFVLIIDDRKLTDHLGNTWLPVEILRFGMERTFNLLKQVSNQARIRKGSGKLGPVITDNGHLIVDLYFDGFLEKPETLERELKLIPGVIESGLFTLPVTKVFVGTEFSVEELCRSGTA